MEVTSKSYGDGLRSMTIKIQANYGLHPGIGEEFDEELNDSLAIDIKLLYNAVHGVVDPGAPSKQSRHLRRRGFRDR